MNGDEVLSVLKEIRDEAKQTNVRLGTVEGRLEFLEHRLSKGLTDVKETLDAHAERLNMLARTQTDAELRLATEVLTLADVTRDVRDLISRKLDDHETVLDLEQRVKLLEKGNGSRERQ